MYRFKERKKKKRITRTLLTKKSESTELHFILSHHLEIIETIIT